MKRNLLLSILATSLFFSSVSLAETMYVTDAWKFEMRESPCFQCKIAKLGIESGAPMESTGEIEGTWIQVVAQDGTVGWMPNNYLSPLPAARNQLDSALVDADRAASRAELASAQMLEVTQELETAGIDIEIIEVTSEDGLATIQAPRIIGNLATLGRQNKELLERNQLLQNEVDLQKAEIDRLEESEMKTFFVYGACAVIAGAFLAIILPRIRPRRSQSEWA